MLVSASALVLLLMLLALAVVSEQVNMSVQHVLSSTVGQSDGWSGGGSDDRPAGRSVGRTVRAAMNSALFPGGPSSRVRTERHLSIAHRSGGELLRSTLAAEGLVPPPSKHILKGSL